MKMFLPIAAALILGVLIGTQLNRYQHTLYQTEHARFDRWTGRLQLIAIDATEEWKWQAATAVSPPPRLLAESSALPTPTVYDPQPFAVVPSSRKIQTMRAEAIRQATTSATPSR